MNRLKFLAVFLTAILPGSFVGAQDYRSDYDKAMEKFNEGLYAEAADIFSGWIPAIKELYGPGDTVVYLDLVTCAGVCSLYAGDYPKAEKLLNEAVSICSDQLGETHPVYATSLNNLAQVYQHLGKYDLAEPLMVKAVEIDKNALGDESPDYAIDLNNLATLYQKMGRFDLALPLMLRATEIDRINLGENNPDYAIILNNLAQLYQDMGMYEKAEPLLIKATEIGLMAYGEDHPVLAIRYGNLGLYYLEFGRYEEAEQLLLRAREIDKASLGEDHPNYARDLNNLAALYHQMGRFDLAESFYIQCEEIERIEKGEHQPDYAVRLVNLAMLYQDMSRYDLAESLHLKAIEIGMETLGETHPDYAAFLTSLARLYRITGRYHEAEPLLTDAMNIYRASVGILHPYYATCVYQLSVIYLQTGRYEQAEPLIIESMSVDKALWGENHLSYAKELNNLAMLRQARGDSEEARQLISKAYEIFMEQLRDNWDFLTEQEKRQFMNEILLNLEFYQSFNLANSGMSDSSRMLAFDIELNRKGILLQSVKATRESILASSDTALINGYNRLTGLRHSIDELYARPPDQRFSDPAELEAEANELEKILTLRSSVFRNEKEEMTISWQDVRSCLAPDEAVVEFASFDYFNGGWTDSTFYCALLLRPGWPAPQMIYLCEQAMLQETLPGPAPEVAQVNSIYLDERGIGSIGADTGKYRGTELYKMVWQPFDSLLAGAATVYYVPSGSVHTISLPAVCCEQDVRLLDRYNLVQLSTSRQLVMDRKPVTILNAAVFGGIDYDAEIQAHEAATEDIVSGSTSSSSANASIRFGYLSGTLTETEKITSLLRKKDIKVTFYSGSEATEESFMAVSGEHSPSVIHVATHGFYFPASGEGKLYKEDQMYACSKEERLRLAEDPLLRSGLAMAGANHGWSGIRENENEEDGILTAKEVAVMNLSNTGLVVLSACQTGLGDVKGAEGVEGLQRAFKIAGAKYILMSLWSVPDKETAEFMVDFYEHLSEGESIREAFRLTRLAFRDKYPDEPYKWAAFVLTE